MLNHIDSIIMATITFGSVIILTIGSIVHEIKNKN
jgi:hypothetical protein